MSLIIPDTLTIPANGKIPEFYIKNDHLNDNYVFVCKSTKSISTVNKYDFDLATERVIGIGYVSTYAEFFNEKLEAICDYFIKKEQYTPFEEIKLD